MAGSLTAGPRPERQWPLTGRDRELTRVREALDGGARIVVVHGAPGIGRSRFLAEAAHRCAALGEHVVELTGSAILSAVPLGVLSSHLTDLAVYDGASADPARLFAEAGARLTGGVPGHRAVLMVDDVSLFDPASVLLVAQLAAAGRARLVATLRHGEALPEPLVAAWSASRDHRLDLPPLGAVAVRALLETVLGGPVAQRAAAALRERSGGNPLYLRELVLGALGDASLQQSAGLWQLTATPTATPALRDLVLGRLAPLDAAERDVLERLAVCGALRPDQLPGDGARRTLAALEEAGLVELRGTAAVLTEPVYGTVLTQTMSRLRVEDLLSEQAALLAERAGGSPDELQVTMWQLEAGVPARPDVVAAAARYAAETGDRASVVRLTEAGLRAAPDDPDLLLLHADAALRLGRAEEALASLDRHPATRADDRLDAATVAAVGRITALAHVHRQDPVSAVAAVDRFRAALPAPVVELELTWVTVLMALGRMAEAAATAADVAALLEGTPEGRARGEHARALPLVCLGRDEQALAAARTAVEVAEATGGRVPGLGVAETMLTLATVQQAAGRYGEARRTAVGALAAATEAHDEVLCRQVELMLGWTALDAGHLDPAERWLSEMVSAAQLVSPVGLVDHAQLCLATRHALAGDHARAAATFAPAAGSVAAPLASAWLAGLGGDRDTALATVAAIAEGAASVGHLAYAVACWRLPIELDRPEAAVAPLAELADQMDSPFTRMLADHARAAADGDHAHLLALADAWKERDALRLAAHAVATAALALRGRAATAARTRAAALAARCGGLVLPALGVTGEPSPLTPREREIAGLAASGSSSKEIATQLFLSSRTVDNHLQSVYTKLGITGRQELAPALSGLAAR